MKIKKYLAESAQPKNEALVGVLKTLGQSIYSAMEKMERTLGVIGKGAPRELHNSLDFLQQALSEIENLEDKLR